MPPARRIGKWPWVRDASGSQHWQVLVDLKDIYRQACTLEGMRTH